MVQGQPSKNPKRTIAGDFVPAVARRRLCRPVKVKDWLFRGASCAWLRQLSGARSDAQASHLGGALGMAIS